ncbi:enoyl-CoA hydratase [Sporichthya sp.]|uniref:enoyl-CoA hydratase n=1 Tax=Sporichthya sp. TaxID=65475 RepID=UPI0017A94374|nr:enoyl-CoA hydratase [Sporichthya sp.]MBA3744249.1 enoyl-CoA hydratase [Sporichthya sp.]
MIESTTHDRVTVLTIDRPEVRNALNIAVCDAIRIAVGEAVSGGARALVLTGSGSSFCSGADFGEVYTGDFRRSLYGMLRAVIEAPVPVVAAVNGPAIGGGTQLAIASDLRVVAPGAVFAVPTAKLGLAVDPWTIRRLAQLAGEGRARALLLACDDLDADAALTCGLADRAGDLEAALALAQRMAELAPLTLAYNKEVLNSLAEPTVDESELLAAFEGCWSSADLAEGRLAREEKRPPVFRGA